jgi:hypothetical protein
VARPRKAAKRAPARGKSQRAKPPTKAVVTGESSGARPKSTGAKKAAAKKAGPAKPKSAAGKHG